MGHLKILSLPLVPPVGHLQILSSPVVAPAGHLQTFLVPLVPPAGHLRMPAHVFGASRLPWAEQAVFPVAEAQEGQLEEVALVDLVVVAWQVVSPSLSCQAHLTSPLVMPSLAGALEHRLLEAAALPLN